MLFVAKENDHKLYELSCIRLFKKKMKNHS